MRRALHAINPEGIAAVHSAPLFRVPGPADPFPVPLFDRSRLLAASRWSWLGLLGRAFLFFFRFWDFFFGRGAAGSDSILSLSLSLTLTLTLTLSPFPPRVVVAAGRNCKLNEDAKSRLRA